MHSQLPLSETMPLFAPVYEPACIALITQPTPSFRNSSSASTRQSSTHPPMLSPRRYSPISPATTTPGTARRCTSLHSHPPSTSNTKSTSPTPASATRPNRSRSGSKNASYWSTTSCLNEKSRSPRKSSSRSTIKTTTRGASGPG